MPDAAQIVIMSKKHGGNEHMGKLYSSKRCFFKRKKVAMLDENRYGLRPRLLPKGMKKGHDFLKCLPILRKEALQSVRLAVPLPFRYHPLANFAVAEGKGK